MKSSLKFLAVLFAVLLFAGHSFAQAPLTASSTPVTLSLIGQETLTVVCTPGTVNFASNPGATVPGSSAVSCVSTWNLSATRTSLTGYSGFALATSALANGTNLIPSSAVSVSYNGNATTPCTASLTATGTGIGAGAACGTTISGNLLTNNFSSTHTDSIAISIAEPNPLPAGTYTGSLLIVFQAL
jgi:hypothetical protein